MHKLITLATTITLLAVKSSSAENNNVWTLERCIEQALANSTQIAQSELNLQKADAELQEILAEKKGSAEFSATAGHVSETMEMELNIPLPGGTMPKIKFGDGNSVDFQVIGRLPLYTGGALNARRNASQYNLKAHEYQSAADTLDLIFQIEIAYWQAAGALLKESSLQQSRLRLERHKDELVKSIKIGVGSPEMLLNVEGRILQVKSALSAVLAEVETAKLNLGAVIGKPGVMITPKGELPALRNTAVDEGTNSVTIDNNRPEMRTIDAKLEQAKAAGKVVRASYLPSVGLVFAYHYAKPGINQVKNDWMSYYQAGMSVSWTIWDWGLRDNRVDKSRMFEREIELRRRDIEEKLTTRCAASLQRLKAATIAEEFAAELVHVEHQRQEMLQVRYELGAATETELLDGEDDLTVAVTSYAEARIKSRIAEAEYRRAFAR